MCEVDTAAAWYNQKQTSTNNFLSEKGERTTKAENVKKRPNVTKEDYMSVAHNRAEEKEDVWEALVTRWVGGNPEFDAVSRWNKANRGDQGTHSGGNRNLDRYKEKLEADTGEPKTELETWQKMKQKKLDLEKPQPSLPEYYGRAKEDLDAYC